MLHQPMKQGEFAAGVIITIQVMTFPGMSPRDPDAVGALPERRQEKLWAHPAGAGNADDADVGGVHHPSHTGQVRGSVTAPVA